MEFVPGAGAAGEASQVSGNGVDRHAPGGSADGAGGGGGGGGSAVGGGGVDPRLYDQMLAEQGGATYSEEELIKPTPRRRTLGSFFMSDRLLERCQHLNECMLRQLEPGDERMKLIPSGYTSIFPLDAPGQDDSSAAGSFGYP